MTVAARLAELGIQLPEPASAVANYVPFVQTGNLLHISGQLSNDASGGIKGTVGADVTPEQARDAARLCGINLLAQMSAALGGDLERAANAFVDNWQRVSELMPEVQRQVNDIYDLDEKYWNQWNDYYRRCLEYAECQGTPPADCQPPPAGPGSAMPQ
jgi:enamine deaminase RidA (YjgF/YER057c/UK114 family)